MRLMVPGFPFDLLSFALVGGRVSGVDPKGLEAELVQAADATRAGSLALIASSAPPDDCMPRPLVWAQSAWRDARTGETPDAELVLGAGGTGMYASLNLDPQRTPVGRSVGTRATALVDYADAHLGTTLGPVSAAVDVRRRSVQAP